MKIWIPGAQGMLGSHFTRLFKAKGIEFIGTDIGQTQYKVDITNLQDVLDFVSSEKITHTINCAAYTQVDKAETDRELAHKVNVIGPQNLGKASKKFKTPIIHFSTDYIFDGNGNTPYEENHPGAPINYYGLTKWEGEKCLLAETPQCCIIRTSWLYGFPGKNFVETMLRLMQENESLRIVSDQFGRPTFCQDLVEVTFQLLNTSGIYHFANSGQTNWHAFVKEINRQALGLGYVLKVKDIYPITTQEYPTPAKRPSFSSLNTKKIENFLGAA